MTDSDIKVILTDTAQYQARYNPVPIEQLPIDCNLPADITVDLNLSNISLPSISKVCAPAFIEIPLSGNPYAPPENCPNGISFNTTLVNVYADVTDSTPRAQLPISVQKHNGDVCTFDLITPDVVIPCFPGGPNIGGTSIIRVIDPNTDITSESELSIIKNAACNWTLQGDSTIVLPKVPCINGISFSPGVMSVTSTCSSLANYTDIKQVTIAKQTGTDCLYSITLPDLKIPCYPNGPNVHGGISVILTDSINNHTADPQIASFSSATRTCCDFKLGGDIEIDIPCSTTGYNVSLANLSILDPFLQTTTTKLTTITKNNCNTILGLPELSIPCSAGISFIGPIQFSLQDFVNRNNIHILGNGDPALPAKNTIDLTNTGVRRLTESCTWDTGMTIPLPIPNCPGGFITKVADTFKVKINNGTTLPTLSDPTSNPNNYPRYSALTFKKTSPDIGGGILGCGFEIDGEINLGLGGFALTCQSLSVGGNAKVQVNIGTTKVDDIILATTPSGCGFEFATTEINLPTLNCPHGFQVTNNLQIVDTTGRPSTSSSITLSPSGCGVVLGGTLILPTNTGGGSGVNTTNWYPGNHNTNDSFMLVTPEGDSVWYSAIGNITDTNKFKVPGTPGSEALWQELFSSNRINPFSIIRCTEEEASTALVISQDNETKGAEAIVKIVPNSYLFQGEGTISRYSIIGLDTPFILKPGESVYLEIVYNNTGAYGESTVAYAAICKGPNFDIDSGVSTINGSANPDYIIASTTYYKLLTSDQAKSMQKNNSGQGITTYSNATTTRIIGLDSFMLADLTALQTNCINTIKNKNDKSVNYQLKSYTLIAKAENGELTDGTNTDNSIKLTKPASNGLALSYLDNNNDSINYVVKQLLDKHVEIQIRNMGSGTANFPIKIAATSTQTTVPDYMGIEPNTNQPDIRFIQSGSSGSNLRYIDFSLPTTITSTTLPTTVTAIGDIPSYTPSGGFNNTLIIGALAENIHVYYTVDGSIPTINTIKNKNCYRYDPSSKPVIDIGITKRVSWIAVHPDFTIAAPHSIQTS